VHKVTVAADLGSMVNPNIVRQQIESSVIFGLSAGLFGRDHAQARHGRAEQLPRLPVVRMNESPEIDITLVANGEKPGGIGEPITALIRRAWPMPSTRAPASGPAQDAAALGMIDRR
jgi:isoquinoline 1-oxidoreductase beta subunit